MYANYIKREVADLNGTGMTLAYYKMALKPMTFEQFAKLCHREGGTDESLIVGVMSLISEKLALCMAEGFSVKLDGIGTFSAKLGMRDDVLPDSFEEGQRGHNAKTIMVKGVSYRADKGLIDNTHRKCTLVKGGESRIMKSKYTLEERIEKAKEYLRKHMFMRVPDYALITGLSRSTATIELRRIAHDPESGITSRGEHSQKLYVLRQK